MRGQEPPVETAPDIPPITPYGEEGTGAPVDVEILPRWNGRPTSFTLARPLIQSHRVLPEGTVVTFNVMPHPDKSKRGVFIGPGDETDESQHVMDLYAMGMFQRTATNDDYRRRALSVAVERGVFEGSEGGPALASLAAMDGTRLEALLRAHRGIGTPEQMRAAERTAARTTGPMQERVWPGAEAPGTARRVAP
jgi:hypothetical protein